MFLTPTTPDDLEVLIGSMKVNKWVDPNNIPIKILKGYKSEFSKPLSDMISTSFTTVIFPSALKVANIIPIHKKNDKLDCNNYCPYLFYLTLVKILRKWCIFIWQVSWIKKGSFEFLVWFSK